MSAAEAFLMLLSRLSLLSCSDGRAGAVAASRAARRAASAEVMVR